MPTNEVNLQRYAQQRRSEVGQRIRAVRSGKGWTQERMSLYLGCSRRRVNRVEQGLTDFGIFELELLARAWEVPMTDLLS